MKKIVMITGSPHKDGTTAMLTEHFCRGAIEEGHDVYRFDAAFHTVHPCIGCEKCNTEGNGCVFKDDMELLNSHIMEADVIAFVSPIYYYDINAQIKAVIDRFYANDARLHRNKKAVLMLALADDNINTAEGAIRTYENMVDYLEWENAGEVVAAGCLNADDLEGTEYLKEAFKTGKNI